MCHRVSLCVCDAGLRKEGRCWCYLVIFVMVKTILLNLKSFSVNWISFIACSLVVISNLLWTTSVTEYVIFARFCIDVHPTHSLRNLRRLWSHSSKLLSVWWVFNSEFHYFVHSSLYWNLHHFLFPIGWPRTASQVRFPVCRFHAKWKHDYCHLDANERIIL